MQRYALQWERLTRIKLWSVGFALLLTLFFTLFFSVPALAATLTLDEYAGLLEEVAHTLRAPEMQPEEIEDALAPLADVVHVRLENGELLSPDSFVRLWAADDDATPAEMAARLDVLRAQLLAAPQDQTHTRLAMLAEILDRPVFAEQESLAERVWRWIESWLFDWFPDWQPTGGGIPSQVSTWVGWVVVGLGALVLIVLGSYWIQGILTNLLGGGENARREIPEDVPPSAAAARIQAQAAAERGDYRQAVRRLYLAALLLLDEQRLLTFDRSQTNREVLAGLPGDSPIAPHLRPVVETFDTVWYGVREPDEPTYLRYRAEIDALDRIARAATSRDARSGAPSGARGVSA